MAAAQLLLEIAVGCMGTGRLFDEAHMPRITKAHAMRAHGLFKLMRVRMSRRQAATADNKASLEPRLSDEELAGDHVANDEAHVPLQALLLDKVLAMDVVGASWQRCGCEGGFRSKRYAGYFVARAPYVEVG